MGAPPQGSSSSTGRSPIPPRLRALPAPPHAPATPAFCSLPWARPSLRPFGPHDVPTQAPPAGGAARAPLAALLRLFWSFAPTTAL